MSTMGMIKLAIVLMFILSSVIGAVMRQVQKQRALSRQRELEARAEMERLRTGPRVGDRHAFESPFTTASATTPPMDAGERRAAEIAARRQQQLDELRRRATSRQQAVARPPGRQPDMRPGKPVPISRPATPAAPVRSPVKPPTGRTPGGATVRTGPQATPTQEMGDAVIQALERAGLVPPGTTQQHGPVIVTSPAPKRSKATSDERRRAAKERQSRAQADEARRSAESKRAAVEEAARAAAIPPPSVSRPTGQHRGIVAHDIKQWRKAFIMQELLRPPLALRDEFDAA